MDSGPGGGGGGLEIIRSLYNGRLFVPLGTGIILITNTVRSLDCNS